MHISGLISYILFIVGLIATTIFAIYYRKERMMYVIAPFFAIGGIVFIAMSVFVSCNANNNCSIDYILPYLLLMETDTKAVSGRWYFGGYFPIWYALVMLILYPFCKKWFK